MVAILQFSPLRRLFSETKAVPPMASGHIQRWALTLSSYENELRYRKGTDQGNCNAFSRLSLPDSPESLPIPGDVMLLRLRDIAFIEHTCPKLEQKSANRSLVSLFQSLLYTYHSLMFFFNQRQNSLLTLTSVVRVLMFNKLATKSSLKPSLRNTPSDKVLIN